MGMEHEKKIGDTSTNGLLLLETFITKLLILVKIHLNQRGICESSPGRVTNIVSQLIVYSHIIY